MEECIKIINNMNEKEKEKSKIQFFKNEYDGHYFAATMFKTKDLKYLRHF